MSTEREALEAAIEADPDNVQAYQVYADFLQGLGDPRGELIALRHAALGKSAAAKAAARKALAFEKKHAAVLVGDLQSIPERSLRLEWRLGFIHHAYIDQPTALGLTTDEVLRRLLAHPSARFLRELMIGRVDRRGNDYRPLVKRLGQASLPSLRTLWLGVSDGDSESDTMLGDLEPLTRAMPRLRSLLINGNGIELGDFELPWLTELSITTWAFSPRAMQSLVRAKIRSLETLFVDFGPNVEAYDEQTVRSFLEAPWLERATRLRIQRIKNADRFAAQLAESPVARAVEHVELALASMTDAGAEALAKGHFPNLKTVDVRYNRLTKAGRDALKKRWPASNLLPQYS